jgi:hypothetical protein
VQTEQCYARLMGASGDIYISGSTAYNYIYGVSFGFAYEQELSNQTCFVDHRGNGDIYIKSGDELSVNIEFIGNVYYSGSPKLQSTISGSGKLIHY